MQFIETLCAKRFFVNQPIMGMLTMANALHLHSLDARFFLLMRDSHLGLMEYERRILEMAAKNAVSFMSTYLEC